MVGTLDRWALVRRGIFWLLLIVFAWVVVDRLTEIEELLATLASGRWPWVAAAAALQIVYYIAFTALYQAAFAVVDVRSRLADLLPITFAAVFVNSTTPSGGTAGLALFVEEARRRGQSGARVAAGSLLVLAVNYGVFALVLAAGLALLTALHRLTALELTSAAILFLFVGVLIGVLLLGLWRPDLLQGVLGGTQALINRLGRVIKRPSLLDPHWADKNARDFTAAAAAIAAHPDRLGRTALIALASHLVNVASLACLFVAFRQTPRIELLVAIYAMTYLFLIVSPTPSGIGVVETVLPLIYTSLGIPTGAGTIINLAFRGLSFWLPLVVGFVLLRRLRIFSGPDRARTEVVQVRLVAVLTGLVGVVNVLSAVRPSLLARVEVVTQYWPLVVRRGGNVTAVLAGFALLLLAQGLWRHKRMAWLLTVAVLITTVIGHLLKGLDYDEALLAALLAGYLITQGGHFHALSDRPSMWHGVKVFLAALAFTLAYGTAGFYFLGRAEGAAFSAEASLRQTLAMFSVVYAPELPELDGMDDFFRQSIYIVGATTMGYALVMLLQPVLVQMPATERERRRARRIVGRYGRSAIAQLALLPDKAYYFSPGGSVVAYGIRGRMAIALGDPIGPPEDVAGAVDGFRDQCRRHDWQAAFYQTHPDHQASYEAAGFNALCTGHVALVTLNGRAAWLDDGALAARLEDLSRRGWRTELHLPPLPSPLVERLRLVSDNWLAHQAQGERRFATAWFDAQYVRLRPAMIALAPDGEIQAFATVTQPHRARELALEMVRYLEAMTPGALEYLLASLLSWGRQRGYERFNLGLRWLAGDGTPDEGLPVVERTVTAVHERIQPLYTTAGLAEVRETFNPIWEPRYLMYPGPASLPAVWATLARLTSGDRLLAGWRFLSNGPDSR